MIKRVHFFIKNNDFGNDISLQEELDNLKIDSTSWSILNINLTATFSLDIDFFNIPNVINAFEATGYEIEIVAIKL